MLIEGVKYYADQPRMLGKTFLRLVSLSNAFPHVSSALIHLDENTCTVTRESVREELQLSYILIVHICMSSFTFATIRELFLDIYS